MQVINWLNLQPQQTDLETLENNISEPLPAREVRQRLIKITLQGYPWEDRPDIVPCYHPSSTFDENECIALPIHDAQNIRPLVWQIAQVRKAEMAENPIQGSFQVLTLDIWARQLQLACRIPDAPFQDFDMSQYSPQNLAWLVEWIEDTYAAALQSVLANLISKGKLRGKLAGDMYIPEQPIPLAKQEEPPLIHHPALHQRIWKILMRFLQRLFGRKP